MERIARREVGLRIDSKRRVFLGQFVGKFRTERNRQDLSTGFYVRALNSKIVINKNHFSKYKVIHHREEIPKRIGAMYRYYLDAYFTLKGKR